MTTKFIRQMSPLILFFSLVFLYPPSLFAKDKAKKVAKDKAKDVAEKLKKIPLEKLYGTILDTRTGEIITQDALLERLSKVRIVYVGEQHNHPVHHKVQHIVLTELHKKNPHLAIGMEMFDRLAQPVLNDYVAKKISEEEFLKRSQYETRWGFPFEFYAPLLRFSRENQLPVVGLNIPREIIRKVSRSGLESLSFEEATTLPDLDLSDQTHLKNFKNRFGSTHSFPTDRLFNYYCAMCLWDDGMAESASKFLQEKKNSPLQMIVYAGSGHIETKLGIPQRAHRRTSLSYATIIPHSLQSTSDIEKEVLSPSYADYIWFTPALETESQSTKTEESKIVEKLMQYIKEQSLTIKQLKERIETLEKELQKSKKTSSSKTKEEKKNKH